MPELADISLFIKGEGLVKLNGSAMVVNKSYNFHGGPVVTRGARLLNVEVCQPGTLRGNRIKRTEANGRDGDNVEWVILESDLSPLVDQPVAERRRELLRLLHEGATEIADARGWDREPFNRAWAALQDGVPDLEIMFAEKPHRKGHLVGVARLRVDETGIHVWLEIQEPSGVVITSTRPTRVSGGSVQEAMRTYGKLIWKGETLSGSATTKRYQATPLTLTVPS